MKEFVGGSACDNQPSLVFSLNVGLRVGCYQTYFAARTIRITIAAVTKSACTHNFLAVLRASLSCRIVMGDLLQGSHL
jgi:hypothetical protein